MTDAIQDAAPLNDAMTHFDGVSDLMFVGVQGQKPCESFNPEDFGLSDEVAGKVAYVLQGPSCKPVYVHPDLQQQGCDVPDIVPVHSNITFDGTMYVLANEGGFDLQEGQLLYKAFKDVCDQYPQASVKAIGIELKPSAKDSPTIFQAKIEPSDLGELLLRVHIWQGDGQVFSLDGQTFLDLTFGEQVLLDVSHGGFNVLEAFSVAPPEKTSAELKVEAPSNNDSATSAYSQDPGCSAPRGIPHSPDTLGPVFAMVAMFWVLRQMRLQMGNKGTDVAGAIAKLLGSDKAKK